MRKRGMRGIVGEKRSPLPNPPPLRGRGSPHPTPSIQGSLAGPLSRAAGEGWGGGLLLLLPLALQPCRLADQAHQLGHVLGPARLALLDRDELAAPEELVQAGPAGPVGAAQDLCELG